MNLPFARRFQAAAALAAFFCQSVVPLLPAQSAGVPQLMNYQGRVTVAGTNFNGTGYFKFSLVDGGSDQNRPAAATATITSSGRVAGLTLTDGGRGYVVKPEVSFDGTGTGATATATLTGDTVTELTVDTPGGGYSTVTPAQVVFTAPPRDVQTTTFWSSDGSGKYGLEPEREAVPLAVQKGLYSVLLGDEALMNPLPPQIFANPDLRLRVWFSQEEGRPFTLLTPDQRIAAVGYALMADAVKPGAITAEMLASNAITLAQLSPELRQTIEGLQAWQATQLPVVTSAATAEAAVDVPFSYQITATGSPTAFAAGGLQAGWTVNTATGLITATPAAAGSVILSLTTTNVAGTSAAKGLTVSVTGPVFVDYATGDDGAAGTQAAPVKTVAQGIAIAASAPVKRGVRVSGAAQTLYNSLWEGFPGEDGEWVSGIGSPDGGNGGAPGTPVAGNGGNGSDGLTGAAGTHGVAGTVIHLSAQFTSTEGGAGTAGIDGTKAGDGGGGGGITNSSAIALMGGGGGGGGGGGAGGKAGKGGKGAGGAFAIVVVNSKVTVTDCALTTGNGGTGGAGSNGGEGGTGFVTPATNGLNPGNGGNGGDGGNGGGGGGGAGGQGGPAIGIIASAGSTLTQSGNTFTLGTAGTGGPGGLRGGSSTNRAPGGANGLRQNILTDVQP